MPQTLSIASEAIPLILGRPALHPVRLAGHEGMSSLFTYELLLKTPDSLNLGASRAADFDLDAFIGREINCVIELDGSGAFIPGATGSSTDHVGAGTRRINALITDAAMWGEEGRHIQYKLTLRPWLYLATLTTDCKIFQNKTVVQILDELLADYSFPVDKRLFDTYPVRSDEGPASSIPAKACCIDDAQYAALLADADIDLLHAELRRALPELSDPRPSVELHSWLGDVIKRAEALGLARLSDQVVFATLSLSLPEGFDALDELAKT